MRQTVVVYFSRTGVTRWVAERLATLLEADLQELREKKPRTGVGGFFGAVRDTLFDRPAELIDAPAVTGRAVVVLGMPVWAAAPPPAVRAFARAADLSGVRVFAFCTYDGSGWEKTFEKLAGLVPGGLAGSLHLKKPRKDPDLDGKLADFARSIRAAMA